MNRLYSLVCLVILAVFMVNCKKDDNGGGLPYVPPREAKEVYIENLKDIEFYLDNNYMIEDGDNISFDSITSGKYKQQAVLRKDPRLKSIDMSNDDYILMAFSDPQNPYGPTKYKYLKSADTIKYKIYYLLLNEGKGENVTSIDSLYMKRTTTSLKNTTFNNLGNPLHGAYYSFPITIPEYTNIVKAPLRTNTGDRQLITKFLKTATAVGETNQGLPTYDKGSAGRIIAFIPSGLGKFNYADGGLEAYKVYITDITLISKKERDHDRDGIPSKFEVKQVVEKGTKVTDAELKAMNLNIHDYFSYDTDGDGIPNFLDMDDDGDGISTKDELSYKVDGEIKYYQYYDAKLKTCSGIPRYLDIKCFPDRKDGEWVWPTASK